MSTYDKADSKVTIEAEANEGDTFICFMSNEVCHGRDINYRNGVCYV